MALLLQREADRGVAVPARCLIGRASLCDLVLTEPTVSAQHAVVQWTGTEWELRDLGSRNGTYLGDRRLDAGGGGPLELGARIRFGRDSPTWELVDIGAPQLMAIALGSGQVRHAEGGYLALPDAQAAEVCIYQETGGAWNAERSGEPEPLVDRAVLTTADGARWRVHLPTTLPGTVEDGADLLLVAGLHLRFATSLDEEYVELVALCGHRRLDLQARAHHYPLLVLARRRLADRAAGLPEGEQGWIRQDELAKMLRMDDNHVNICIHRARTQLGRLGVHDAAALVERRARSRQLRIGSGKLELVAA